MGLVTNAVVLWNTLYMQEALSWIRSNGEEIGVEDIARLSPLMLGISYAGALYVYATGGYFEGELRERNFNLNNELSSSDVFASMKLSNQPLPQAVNRISGTDSQFFWRQI
jgi:hypothetical protein